MAHTFPLSECPPPHLEDRDSDLCSGAELVSWPGEPDPPLAAPGSHHNLGLCGELLGHQWLSAHTAGQRERTAMSPFYRCANQGPSSSITAPSPTSWHTSRDTSFLLFSFAPCGAQLNLILWLHSELAPGDFSECPMGGGGWGRGVGRTLGRALRLGPPAPSSPVQRLGQLRPWGAGVYGCHTVSTCTASAPGGGVG